MKENIDQQNVILEPAPTWQGALPQIDHTDVGELKKLLTSAQALVEMSRRTIKHAKETIPVAQMDPKTLQNK